MSLSISASHGVDGHALPLPSTELVRIGRVDAIGILLKNLGEQFPRLAPPIACGKLGMRAQHLSDLFPHPNRGMKSAAGS